MLIFILTLSIVGFYIAMTKYGLEEHSVLKLKPKMGQILIKKSFRERLKKEVEEELKVNIEKRLREEILKEYKERYKNIKEEIKFDLINKGEYYNTNYEVALYKQKLQKLEEENIELKAKLNQQKENYKNYLKNKEENIKKGQEYEYKIKCYFDSLGYNVYPNGYINGKKDKGIDLIAYKNNEVHLIQCKCYKNPPKQELIRKFVGDCEIYIKNNQNKLNNKTIYKDFITSCKEKDYGVIKFLEENKNLIDYLVIE